MKKLCNGFTCERCGLEKEGGIHIRGMAHFGSKYDSLDLVDIFFQDEPPKGLFCIKWPQICDECLEEIIPDEKVRFWITDPVNHSLN